MEKEKVNVADLDHADVQELPLVSELLQIMEVMEKHAEVIDQMLVISNVHAARLG